VVGSGRGGVSEGGWGTRECLAGGPVTGSLRLGYGVREGGKKIDFAAQGLRNRKESGPRRNGG